MMLERVLFVVLLGLTLQCFGNGDDSVDVVLACLEIVPFQIFVAVVSSAFVILKPALVLFLGIIVSHVDAGKNELWIILQILAIFMKLIPIKCMNLCPECAFQQWAVLNNLLDDLLKLSFIHQPR
jgi:hypothetical protein